MPGKMYFGNKARMKWVKCPDSGMGMNGARYSTEGIFLNGGSYVRNSATGHRVYDVNWNFLRANEKDEIRSYLDGVYGPGLIYFLDPFAMPRNVLPTAWASPAVAADGGPSLVGGLASQPTKVTVTPAVPASPVSAAVYALESATVFKEVWVPVPDGFQLHMSARYTAPGTGKVTATRDGGATTTVAGTGATTTLAAGPSGYTVRLAGTGALTLTYIMAQVLPVGQTPDFSRFYPGVGHSGVRLSGDINDVGYSSPQALDYSALSFTMRETGTWE